MKLNSIVKTAAKALRKPELKLYRHLKRSVKEIKLYQKGKLKLKTIEEVLADH